MQVLNPTLCASPKKTNLVKLEMRPYLQALKHLERQLNSNRSAPNIGESAAANEPQALKQFSFKS